MSRIMTKPTTKESLNLPDSEEFTIEMLAERWGCGVSLIDNYIKNGRLRQAFASAHNTDLQVLEFYEYKIDAKEREADVKKRYDDARKIQPNMPKSLSEEELQSHVHIIRQDAIAPLDAIHIECLLDVIENEERLDKYLHPIAIENIVGCPKYLYVTRERQNKYPVFQDDYVLAYNFYDFHGNVLLPISSDIPTYDDNHYRLDFVRVKLGSLIIPLEEVKRFEQLIHQNENEDDKEPKRKGKHKKSDDNKNKVYSIITEKLKLEHLKLPKKEKGKAGVAAAIRKFCEKNKEEGLTRAKINRALKDLENEGRIKYITDSK